VYRQIYSVKRVLHVVLFAIAEVCLLKVTFTSLYQDTLMFKHGQQNKNTIDRVLT